MSTPDAALIESPSLRAKFATRTDVLDKVKALALLPDDIHATTEMVATYFEVKVEAIESVVRRNKKELEGNGYRVVRGQDLKEFETVIPAASKRRALALYDRRAILNIGQLFDGSPVAEKVRGYLLDVEEIAPDEQREDAIRRAAIGRAQIRMLEAAMPIVRDRTWLDGKVRLAIARGLGEEPEIDPLDKPLYVPDFIKSKGVTKRKDIASIQSWFGRRAIEIANEIGVPVPEKRSQDNLGGDVRETTAWTQRNRALFEEVWRRYYADKYETAPAVLV